MAKGLRWSRLPEYDGDLKPAWTPSTTAYLSSYSLLYRLFRDESRAGVLSNVSRQQKEPAVCFDTSSG